MPATPSTQRFDFTQITGRLGREASLLTNLVLNDIGRKTSKMTKSGSKKEPIWPLQLEEKLFEALLVYHPTSKDCRTLQRFPRRNKYVAEYIRVHTGKERTAKQVGSRLQQLRETCEVPWVLDLINNKDFTKRRLLPTDFLRSPSPVLASPSPVSTTFRSTPSYEASTPASSPCTTPVEELCIEQPPAIPMPSIISVNLSLWDVDAHYAPPELTLNLDETPSLLHSFDVHAPHPMEQNPPSVNLFSLRLPPSVYRVVSSVYVGDQFACSDAEKRNYLKFIPATSTSPGFFQASFVPEYWATIISHPEVQYTMIQDIYVSKQQANGIYTDLTPGIIRIQYSFNRMPSPTSFSGHYHIQHNPVANAWCPPLSRDDLSIKPEALYDPYTCDPESSLQFSDTLAFNPTLPHPSTFYSTSFDTSRFGVHQHSSEYYPNGQY